MENWIKDLCPTKQLTDPFLSIHFKVNHILVFSIVILTFVSSYYAIILLVKRNIFSNCTRIVFFFSLFNANVQQLNILVTRIHGFYKSIVYADQPCKLMYTSEDCYILENINYFTYIGAMTCLMSLTIDRLIAYFYYNYYTYRSNLISFILCFISFFLCLAIHLFVFWGDPWDDVMPMCYYPTVHSLPRFTRINFYMTFFVFTNILVNLLVLWKSYLNRQKNRVYDTAVRYKTRENDQAIRAVCFICITQFIFFSLSPISAFIMSFLRYEISPAIFHGSFIWTSGITYSQLCLPVIICYTIKRVIRNRKMDIKTMTTTYRSTDSHIQELRKMWA